MVFCVSCGNNLGDNAQFCSNCGARKVKPEPTASKAQDRPKADTASTKTRGEPEVAFKNQPSIESLDVSMKPKMFWVVTPIWWAALGVAAIIVVILLIIGDIIVFDTSISEALTTFIFVTLTALIAIFIGGFFWSLPLYTSARDYLIGLLPQKDMLLRTVLYSVCVFLIVSAIIFAVTPEREYQFLVMVVSLWLGIIATFWLALVCVFAYKFSRKTVAKMSAVSTDTSRASPQKRVLWALAGGCLVAGAFYGALIHSSDIFQDRGAIFAEAEDSPEKLFELAEKYQFGDEIFFMSDKKYRYYLEDAARFGHGEARYKLAIEYLNDDDIPNYRKHLEQSADSHYGYGQYKLGKAYQYGEKGYNQDRERALFWMNKAAANGEASAKAELKRLSPKPMGAVDAERYLIYFTDESGMSAQYLHALRRMPTGMESVLIDASSGPALLASFEAASDRGFAALLEEYANSGPLFVTIDAKSKRIQGCATNINTLARDLEDGFLSETCP